MAEATDGNDPELVIAALLHDAVEDQGISRETIAQEFGARVAGIVAEVTDDKNLPKAERKRKQVEAASRKSTAAKTLKLADKLSNVRSLASSPAKNWSTERKLEYIRWAREVVGGLRGASPVLEAAFDRAVVEAEEAVKRAAQ